MVVALSGCVITGKSAYSVSYRAKCDKCGYLEPRTDQIRLHGKETKNSTNCICRKCGSQFKAVILET